MKKFIKIIKSTYLCIRYPFLYPRNRFDDKHHAYLLSSLISKLYKKSILYINITGKLIKENEKIENYKYYSFLNNHIKYDKENNKIIITNEKCIKEFDISNIIYDFKKFEVIGFRLTFAFTGTPIIILNVKCIDENDNKNYGFSYNKIELIINKINYNLYNITKFIDTKILDNIFILPTYTEWDSLDEGWKKSFGKQLLKEIKSQLIKDKMLYKWRITQLKEKFGSLRIYCNYASEDLYKIIDKYEDISTKTCIKCGNNATHMSKGYILPYCDNCHKNK